MHRLLPIGARAGWWSPRLSPGFVWLVNRFRPWAQRWSYGLTRIEWSGLEHLRSGLERGDGVLLIANHYTYSDPFVLAEAAQLVGRPFYYMTAWQVFGTSPWIKRQALRLLGSFSVDREGTDLRAFRKAVEILHTSQHPLMVFPEGEMYHTSDRVMPFHEGPAAMLLSAMKKSPRPIVCIPAAFKYFYLDDPTPALAALASRLEESLHWRPRPDLPLPERIQRLAAGSLALKETEALGSVQAGSLADRLTALAEYHLARLEQKYEVRRGAAFPLRVKTLRQRILRKKEDPALDSAQNEQFAADLEDVFLVTQLLSYPDDYVAENPTLERLAETFDKLEEDVLGVPLAKVRGPRRVTARCGEPIRLEAGESLPSVAELTATFEQSVQGLLDQIQK
jgi:hypothetical protein